VLLAAGLSASLHAAALLALGGERPPPKATAAAPAPVELEVLRLSGVVPAARAAPAPVAARAAPRPPNAAKAPPSPVTDVLAARVEATEPAVAGAQETSEPGPAAPATPAPAELSASGASAAAPTTPEPGNDALDTAALSRRLQEGALHCYPAAASRFRQSGETQVTFCLDAAGALREATVASSSGSPLLDRAATLCVIPAAAPFEPRTFGRCFTVPVRFRQ
jgi:protein TonB